MSDRHQDGDSAKKRWAWFVGLWAAGVVVVSGFAYGVKWLIGL